MSSMKKVFENETKIRINLMGSSKSEKSALIFDMAIPGVFTKQNNIKSDIFPTEVLYSSPRNNYAKVYLDFEEKDRHRRHRGCHHGHRHNHFRHAKA